MKPVKKAIENHPFYILTLICITMESLFTLQTALIHTHTKKKRHEVNRRKQAMNSRSIDMCVMQIK